MDFDPEEISSRLGSKVSDNMMRRNASLENGVRSSCAQMIVSCARAIRFADSPEVKLAVVNLANILAAMTHELGMIPRDVMNEAFQKALEDMDPQEVIGEMIEETNSRAVNKLNRLTSGESVPPSSEDGIFLGYDTEEGHFH